MPAAPPVPPPADRPRTESRPAFAPARAEGGAVCVMAAAGLLAAGFAVWPTVDPTPSRAAACRLDVNAAGRSEWALLRGVGPTLAGQIVDDRTARGPFVAPPDLLAVKGVGPKTFARLAPHLRFPPAPQLPDDPAPGPAVAAR